MSQEIFCRSITLKLHGCEAVIDAAETERRQREDPKGAVTAYRPGPPRYVSITAESDSFDPFVPVRILSNAHVEMILDPPALIMGAEWVSTELAKFEIIPLRIKTLPRIGTFTFKIEHQG